MGNEYLLALAGKSFPPSTVLLSVPQKRKEFPECEETNTSKGFLLCLQGNFFIQCRFLITLVNVAEVNCNPTWEEKKSALGWCFNP